MPGPVIRVRQGAEVKVRLVNKLTQPTTLCWHGVRIANAMAGLGGLTQKPVMPGESFGYSFKAPDSGLYWYHPHVFPNSAEQIQRGLYGALIVDEASPRKVDDDILVVIDDWALDEKGQIKEGFLDPGRVGSLVTVNGRAVPAASTVKPGGRLRLRIVNVCASRTTFVGFDQLEATVVGIDGQPSEIFQPARATIPIGPGSRFDVMVDVPKTAKEPRVVLRGAKGADQPLMQFTLTGESAPELLPVAKLPDNPLLPTRIPLERSLRRELVIDQVAADKSGSPWRWSLGGTSSDGISGKPLFSVKRGGAVTLTFINKTAEPQQMHVAGHVFRLLHDMDDGWDPYWRDTVLLVPGKTKHIAFVADNPGKWVVESLTLANQVTGLAGWFEVT